MNEYTCDYCNGSRLNKESTAYKIGNESIKDLTNMNLSKFYNWANSIQNNLNNNQLKNFISNF